MAHSIVETTKSVIKHWYLLLLVGIIFIIAGIWSALTPLTTYLALSALFALSFSIAGSVEIVFAVANRKSMQGWGWTLVFGLFNLLIGIILYSNPLISIATLPLYIGYVVLFRSVMTIGVSLDRGNYGRSGQLLIPGILGLIFSFVLLWNPGFAGLTLVAWITVALIATGIYSILFSLRLKKLS